MFFRDVPEGKPDPIFGLNEAFQADTRPNKVNLIGGIYRDDALKTCLMPSVRKAKEFAWTQDLIADYLPIDGLRELYDQVGALSFGEAFWKEHHSRIYATQTIGGTGALYVGGQFLFQAVSKTIAISDPTWANHRPLFERIGFQVVSYSYYSREKHGIEFEKMCVSLRCLPEGSLVLLHPVCHNPTGADLSLEEWKEVSRLCKKGRLFPFFDFAYQGFGEGIKQDRRAIEIFFQEGHEMAVAYSCAKNCSSYGQRVGVLFLVGANSIEKSRIASQVKPIIRVTYSNPPSHGARVVAYLLQDASLRLDWERELAAMRQRLMVARVNLVQRLSPKITSLDFEFLRHRKGMFAFLDLDKPLVERLTRQFGIYLTDNGRISLSGLSSQNVDYVAEAILTVCEGR